MKIPASDIDAKDMNALREKTPAQLKTDLKTLRGAEVDQKFQKVFGLLEDNTKPRKTRQNSARVLTILREKQIQQFLLNDPEVAALLAAGKIHLSGGKNDPKRTIARADLTGTDTRTMTLVQRLWSHLRKDRAFFERTRTIPRV